MKRIIGGAAAALALALVGAGTASAAPTDTITTNWSVPTFPAAPPYTGTYTGTYSDTLGETGTVSVRAVLAAVPAPSTGVLHTFRTYTDANGDTLVLRCTQIAKDPSGSEFPSTGSCAVLSGTGIYAGLSGAGKISGITSLTETGANLADVVTFG
jgi:hypothetical protein